MNILMLTNTYKPIMGGLEKSVEIFSKGYRAAGHRVIIVAPEFENMLPEVDVIRIPAIHNFNGTDFSIQLPIPGVLAEVMGDFKPDIVHSHHPFLIGDTALRLAYKYNVPLVFTNHTLYEENTHYMPGDTETLKKFVIELSVGYANLADQVFAPSESIVDLLRSRGVKSLVDVVPTGIEVHRFAKKNKKNIREKMKLPAQGFIIGHLGRLAPEKNLEFLTKAVILFLKKEKNASFLLVGKGPSEEAVKALFEEAGLTDRLYLTGQLIGQDLADAYQAMDVFVFASQSETQGLVLTEAMASCLPVVAVDAPGVREVVKDKINGRLIPEENTSDFVEALAWVAGQKPEKLKQIEEECLKTAESFSLDKSISRALEIYSLLVANKEFVRQNTEDNAWSKTVRLIQAQWDLTKNLTKATKEAFK